MPHECHIYSKAYNMAKAKICAYPQSYCALSHWKCEFFCCDKCPCGNLPDQEKDDQYSNTSPSIIFYIYHLIFYCTTYGRIPLNDKKVCHICKMGPASEKSIKYTLEKSQL